MANKRIIDLQSEALTVTDDMFIMTDSDTNGSMKYRLSRLSDQIDNVDDAVQAEATARTNAINAEVTARVNAINAEATARQAADTALEADVSDLKEDLNDLGLSVVNGALNVTYTVA